MTQYTRNGNRWTVNECIKLQREFELLELSIDEISERHQRTPNAIMFKLDQEGFSDYNTLYNNYHNLKSRIPIKTTNNEYLEWQYDVNDNQDYNEGFNPNNINNCDDDNTINDEKEKQSKQQAKKKAKAEQKNYITFLEKQVVSLNKSLIEQTKSRGGVKKTLST